MVTSSCSAAAVALQGCTKEPEEALRQKAQGTAWFSKADYQAAAQHYSGRKSCCCWFAQHLTGWLHWFAWYAYYMAICWCCFRCRPILVEQLHTAAHCFIVLCYLGCHSCVADALTWLPSASQPAEAARLHANRALCLLKLADADKSAPAAAASGPGAIVLESCREADPGSRGCRDVRKLAAAAMEDCTAALGCCEQGLKHKVSSACCRTCRFLAQAVYFRCA